MSWMNVQRIYQMALHIMSHSFHKYIFLIDMCSSLSAPINCKHWSISVLILQCFSICILEKDNFLKIRLNLRNWDKKLFKSLRDRWYLSFRSWRENWTDRSFSRTSENIFMNERTKGWYFCPFQIPTSLF